MPKIWLRKLQDLDVKQGTNVALLGGTSQEFVTLIQAIWLCGATVVVLPLPFRLSSLEQFITGTVQRIVDSDSSMVFIQSDLQEFCR